MVPGKPRERERHTDRDRERERTTETESERARARARARASERAAAEFLFPKAGAPYDLKTGSALTWVVRVGEAQGVLC